MTLDIIDFGNVGSDHFSLFIVSLALLFEDADLVFEGCFALIGVFVGLDGVV